MRSLAIVILIALAVSSVRLVAAEGAPAKGAAQAPPAAQAKRVSVKNLLCGEYLRLPDDIRPMVAAWVHGYYYREGWKDAWELDLDRARSLLAALNDACKETPRASFRYKFAEVVKKSRAAAGSR